MEVFPQPRELHWSAEEAFAVTGFALTRCDSVVGAYGTTIATLLDSNPDDSDRLTVSVLSHADIPHEGYRLTISPTGVTVEASDSRGALHGVRTLVELLELGNAHLRPCLVVDHPSYRHRGILVESYWGSDLMTYPEWTGLIDGLAALKFNTIALSLYGCWDLRHDRDRGEFLFVPLSDFPELATPHRYRTWDSETQLVIEVDYLPRIFDEDLFGSIARYAESQGLRVVPLFGGPGHSSYLPRALPGLSAVDENGVPTEFGYCVTDPERTALLVSVFDNLVRQHLIPNGITTLAVPGDEFYPIRNVNPDDPMREYTPYCRCEGCGSLSPAELLVRYFTLIGEFLAERGIQMLNWQDSLVRENGLDMYEEALASSTALSPIVSWWRYNEPIPRVDGDRSWETWVTPSPGIIGSLFEQNLGLNIEQMLREGVNAGAAGVLAYSMPDPVMHRNFALLADLSWNYEGSGGAPGFDARWARRVSPADPTTAGLAYRIGDSIIGSYALMNYLANHLLPYFSTAPYGVTVFPDDLVRPLSVPAPALTSVLRQIRDTMRESMALMPSTTPLPGWPDPRETWLNEGHRLAEHADLFLRFIELARRLHTETLEQLEPDLVQLEADGIALLNRIAETKVRYQQPSVLREHLGLVGEFRSALGRLVAQPEKLPTPTESWHAWLF